jgi:YggT family protein
VSSLFHWLARLIEAYVFLIMLPYAILSWFRIEPGSTLAKIQYFLYRAVEPVLRPVRRLIPAAGGIDLSFLVVSLVLLFFFVPLLDRVG